MLLLYEANPIFSAPPGLRIREALANPATLEAVAQNARREWSERFTLVEYQRRILAILERVGSSARA